MGNMTREGRAGHYDVIMGLAERIGAQCYPLPAPVVASTVEEKIVLQAQISFRALLAFVKEANVLMMNIGYVDHDAPLYGDGFITREELETVLAAGAVGDIFGNCFDAAGHLLDIGYHERLTSFRLPSPAVRPTLIAQCGAKRVLAMRAALRGRLANGVITDEETAQLLIAADKDSGRAAGRSDADERKDLSSAPGTARTPTANRREDANVRSVVITA